ncbi:MAG: cytochrome P450, partial [Myxococcota bacterium]
MSAADALATEQVLGPDEFAEHGYPHAAWKTLRREAPVKYFDMGPRPGFWAVTRRADIVWLSKQPTEFLNAPRVAVFADSPPPDPSKPNRAVLRHLLNMDPPDHAEYRNLASSWFTPRTIGRRRAEIERIADDLIDEIEDKMATKGEVDFVEDFTAPLTLSVLADMLGVPRSDWRRMFDWTNQIAGASDPEYQVGGGDSGQQMRQTLLEMNAYFAEMVEARRAEAEGASDDITSVLAKAEFRGGEVPTLELLSYFALLVVAGNETTRNAASGGLLALIENPGELAKLQADPSLVKKATEEIVRWTSPVIQFCRTPVADLELHGQKIPAG